MKRNSLFSFLLIFAIAPTFISAQTSEKENQPNFFEIQRKFKDYWKEKIESLENREGGKIEGGYNQYKRWEYFWEDRLYPSGVLQQPDILLRETKKMEAMRRKNESLLGIAATVQWNELGPTTVPTSSGGGSGRVNNICLLPDYPDIIWAATAGGGAWQSTDAGKNWRCTTDRLPTLGVTDIAIAPGNPDIVYIATGDGDGPGGYDQPIAYSAGVLKSTDGGETWQQTGLQYNTTSQRRIYRLLQHPDNANILFAGTDNGIFKTTDAGATWTSKISGNFRDMEFKPENPSIMYACNNNQIYRSKDGGENWERLDSKIPSSIGRISIAVTYAHSEYIYAVTARSGSWDFGGFYRSTDGGNSWTLTATTPNIIGRDLDGNDHESQQGWYDLCVAASNSKANTVYVGGINIWKSTNGGNSWTIATHWYGADGTPYVHADIHGITAGYDIDEMYVGCDGGVFKSINQKTWENLSDGMGIMQFYRISGSQQNEKLILGGAQDNGTSLLSNISWREVGGGDGMNCLIDYKNSNNMYISMQNGAVRRSNDGGLSFSGTINETTTGENGGWVTPFILHPTNPQILYAGFQNVWKTTNGGSSWSKLGALPGSGATLSYLAIAPSNPDVIIAGNASRIYKTTDGGISWNTLTTPASSAIKHVAFHSQNADIFWIVYSGYSSQKVFETNNGGSDWTNISSGLPSIPINCIVYQPDSPNRLYVGTDLGVFTRDSISKTWIQYGEGLPNVIVNWLDIYKAEKKLRAGTFGRGMWEVKLSECGAVPISAIALGPTSICEGDSVVLQASDGYSEYQWSSGETSQKITVTKSGSYQVVVTNANGCKGGSIPIVVTVNQIRTPMITSNKPFGICPSDSIVLDAGLGFATYLWSTGDSTRRITVMKPGIYIVTVGNAFGCKAVSAPVTLAEFPPAFKPPLYKYRDTISTYGGKTYQWYRNGKQIVGASKSFILLTQDDIGASFKVVITDDNGCVGSSESIVIETVGVKEFPKLAEQWELSPNPASGSVTLSGYTANSGSIIIEIYDAAGLLISTMRFEAAAGSFTHKFDVLNLASGVYIYSISTPDGVVHRLKLIRE